MMGLHCSAADCEAHWAGRMPINIKKEDCFAGTVNRQTMRSKQGREMSVVRGSYETVGEFGAAALECHPGREIPGWRDLQPQRPKLCPGQNPCPIFAIILPRLKGPI